MPGVLGSTGKARAMRCHLKGGGGKKEGGLGHLLWRLGHPGRQVLAPEKFHSTRHWKLLVKLEGSKLPAGKGRPFPSCAGLPFLQRRKPRPRVDICPEFFPPSCDLRSQGVDMQLPSAGWHPRAKLRSILL